MSNVVGIALIIVAGAQVLGTVAYLICAGRLLRRLEVHHPAVHESLGRPLLIAHNTPRNNVLFLRWLWNRDFDVLPNSDSIALAKLVRSQLVCLLAGFALLISMFLVISSTL